MGTKGVIHCKKIALKIREEEVLFALGRFLSIFWEKWSDMLQEDTCSYSGTSGITPFRKIPLHRPEQLG
jgi:hypothetical protein